MKTTYCVLIALALVPLAAASVQASHSCDDPRVLGLVECAGGEARHSYLDVQSKLTPACSPEHPCTYCLPLEGYNYCS